MREICQQTDAQIHRVQGEQRNELELMYGRVIQRQRAMEETLYANGRCRERQWI